MKFTFCQGKREEDDKFLFLYFLIYKEGFRFSLKIMDKKTKYICIQEKTEPILAHINPVGFSGFICKILQRFFFKSSGVKHVKEYQSISKIICFVKRERGETARSNKEE